MREILFRGKRDDNGNWAYGYYCSFKGSSDIFVPFTEEEEKQNEGHIFSAIGGLWHNVIPETVGQFTGKTDKNGKKVFEHDILQLFTVWADGTREKCGKVIVQWWEHDQCYVLTTKDGYHCDDFGNLGLPEYYEVIGNIHDNPELLEE